MGPEQPLLGCAAWNKDLDAALEDCNGALSIKPDDAYLLDSRGLVYFRKGDCAKAIAEYDAALKIDPKNADSLYVRGIAKLRMKDQAGASAGSTLLAG